MDINKFLITLLVSALFIASIAVCQNNGYSNAYIGWGYSGIMSADLSSLCL